MSKILYLECFSGISGDMTVGALLDLGANEDKLKELLASLNVDGYEVRTGRTNKCGIDAFKFDVILEAEHENHIHHDEEHSHHGEAHSHHVEEHSHHGEEHSHHDENHNHHGEKHSHYSEGDHHAATHNQHVQDHHHIHEHNNKNCDGEHTHHHSHEHRNIKDVYEIIDRIDGHEKVKQISKKIFMIVAEAESKAHGISVEEVHFHEVGAIDSIVDIISTAFCVVDLEVDQVIVSKIYEGQGHVRCQHGIIPVPVPATLSIASTHGLKLHLTETRGEMVTPTGAAIAAGLKTRDQLPQDYTIKSIGVGAGTKDFEKANILRAMILEEESNENLIWILETNLDDCTGEALGYTMEKLMEAGARDVFYSPIYMKKNRPAYLLQVMCQQNNIETMEDLIFQHTTTIGIRKFKAERRTLERRIETIITAYGEAQVKICQTPAKTYCYPEYESIKAICDREKADYQTVYHEVMKCAMKNIES